MNKKIFSAGISFMFLLFVLQPAFAQNGVAIAATTATADVSAMLDVQSTIKGVLVPRMLNSQRSTIATPANGLLVFCTDVPSGFYYNSGSSSSPVWVLLSAGALSGTGTTNYDAVWTGSGVIGTGLLYESGTSVGIGTTTAINNPLTVNNAGTTAATVTTYPFAVARANAVDFTIGSDASNVYEQSWNSKPLILNNQGNNVGIGTTPSAQLHTTGTVRFQNYPSGILSTDATGLLKSTPLTITGTTNQIDITNGNGVSGNPTIAIDAAITNALVPSGTIVAYGGTTAPTGWLICDGTSYTRTTYAALFAVIGTNFGTASGTTFNVPDLRGRFTRGWDNTANNDPDHAARTALNTGGNTANAVGSYQADMIQTHQHQFGADDGVGPDGGYTTVGNFSYDANSSNNGGGVHLATKTLSSTYSTGWNMGDQTHPRNVYVQYIIKQ